MERPPQRREDAGSSRPALKVFSDLKTAEYGAPGHPEAPFRVRRTFELLKAAGLAKDDPIAGLRLDKATFRTIGALLAKTRLPRFAVLEGGYSEDLPRLVETFLDGFF